jgi:hypothetical protein
MALHDCACRHPTAERGASSPDCSKPPVLVVVVLCVICGFCGEHRNNIAVLREAERIRVVGVIRGDKIGEDPWFSAPRGGSSRPSRSASEFVMRDGPSDELLAMRISGLHL